ncbi:MAG TPA: hypothetical protein VH331_10200 [Allosphingosinicella sp.]|nr:hypothetical protein [Allosphingosinicella sp.]
MLALAAAALLLVQPAPAPSNVSDDEIAWITGAENRFWQDVMADAAASPLVQGLLERDGFQFVCRGMEGLHGRLVARYFGSYRDSIVHAMREQVPLGNLFDAVEAGPLVARGVIGGAAFDRALNTPSVAKRLSVRAASVEMQARMKNFGAPGKPSDRPKAETMVRVRLHPDMIRFWCNLSDEQRERDFGGFLEVDK